MNPFQFVIIPNPQNTQRPFRARAKLGTQVTESELLPAVAADAGVSEADCRKVITSLFKIMLGHLRQTRPIAPILKLFRAIPSISGSFATNDPSGDELKAGIAFTLAPTPEAEAAMITGISIEKTGEVGTVTPHVGVVVLSPGGQPNRYSTTAALKVSGDHFRGSGPTQPWCSAALVLTDGTDMVPLSVFACSQTEVLLSPAPAGTTGTRYLRITAGWDSSLFAFYSEPLTLQS